MFWSVSEPSKGLYWERNIEVEEHWNFKDVILVNFYPLGIRDCLFRNNSNDNKKAVYSNKEDFFTPKGIISLVNNFYSAGVIQRFFEWKEMSLWEKNSWIWFQVRFGFPSGIFPEHETSCLYFALIQEIPQQVRQQLRPKPKSSGLGVEANLDFHDKNFFFQCSNISKQGVYLQVVYQGIV